MLKIITILTKVIVILLATLLFSSCKYDINLKSITGSGNVTKENRKVENTFKSIEVSNGIEVIIEQSNETKISVEADDNLQKHITTKVVDGVLTINCEYSSFINVKSQKVIVKMPIIESLQASTGSSITSDTSIKSDKIILNASTASRMNLDLESDALFSNSSTGSSLILKGKALELNVKGSSGSTTDATHLFVNTIKADASSGSSIKIHPIVSLEAEATSGGNITYDTHPKSIQKKSSSGGSINEE